MYAARSRLGWLRWLHGWLLVTTSAGVTTAVTTRNRRQSVTGGERDDQLAMNDRQWARCHDQAAIRRAGKCSDGALDFTGVAHVDRVRLHPERGPPIGFKAEKRILFRRRQNGSRRNVAGFRSQENLIQIFFGTDAGGYTLASVRLCSDFRAPRKNDPLLPDAGTWRNNHVYEGISDAPRASGTLMG